MAGERKLTAVYVGRHLEAEIVKSRLESFGIPAILKYESAGLVYGVTVDGLGQTAVLVPEDLAEDATRIITPAEDDDIEQ